MKVEEAEVSFYPNQEVELLKWNEELCAVHCVCLELSDGDASPAPWQRSVARRRAEHVVASGGVGRPCVSRRLAGRRADSGRETAGIGERGRRGERRGEGDGEKGEGDREKGEGDGEKGEGDGERGEREREEREREERGREERETGREGREREERETGRKERETGREEREREERETG
ncbi:unnamed protein product [Arctogadus glacialis]